MKVITISEIETVRQRYECTWCEHDYLVWRKQVIAMGQYLEESNSPSAKNYQAFAECLQNTSWDDIYNEIVSNNYTTVYTETRWDGSTYSRELALDIIEAMRDAAFTSEPQFIDSLDSEEELHYEEIE